MKIDLKVLAKLAKTYAVNTAPSSNKLAATIAACTKAPAQYEPILTGNGYTWDDQLNAYVAPEQEIYYFAPKNVFLWIWNGMLMRALQGTESLQKWVQGNADYPEGKANSFMGIYKEMTGQSDASTGGAGVAVADPESDEETKDGITLPTEPTSEPTDISFTGTGERGAEYVPQTQNPADLIIKQILRKAKINPAAKLSKQAPIRLPTNDIIDLYQRAQKMTPPDKEKLMAFIKTIKPLSENVAKMSTINELVRMIVKGVLNEANNLGDFADALDKRDSIGKYSSKNQSQQRVEFADQEARGYVQSLANKLWPDPTDPHPNARGHWRVSKVRRHPSGEVSYIVSQEVHAVQTRHLINKGNEWYYFNPQAKGTERKWKKVTDSEVRVPRVPGEEGDAGYANEMTGTAAVSPVSTPFAFSKRGTPKEEQLDEMTTTGNVAGYNIPAAFSKRGGSEKGIQGSEKLGYTLTGAGKKEMQRTADKLLENKDGTPVCNKCGKPLHYAGQIECHKCGKVQ